jgi:hypothetical protein
MGKGMCSGATGYSASWAQGLKTFCNAPVGSVLHTRIELHQNKDLECKKLKNLLQASLIYQFSSPFYEVKFEKKNQMQNYFSQNKKLVTTKIKKENQIERMKY